MSYVKVGRENSTDIHLYYEDHGPSSADPVVLIHGYPLNGMSWERQTAALLKAGKRVITYDRRGFGRSSQPSSGYNYDTFTQDLHELVTSLKLEKFSLAGFSMGGGEVVRYIAQHGGGKVRRAVLLGGVPPYLVKAKDNAEGVDPSVFSGIEKAITADRYAFFKQFFQNFYNADKLKGSRVSDEVLQASWNTAALASPIATLACVATWTEDFRADVAKVNVPTLVIHGDSDRIVPFEASGKRTAKMIKGAELVVISGGPHDIGWTHAEEVNKVLVPFLSGS